MSDLLADLRRWLRWADVVHVTDLSELSFLSGVSERLLAAWFGGLRVPTPDGASRLQEALEYEVLRLYGPEFGGELVRSEGRWTGTSVPEALARGLEPPGQLVVRQRRLVRR